MQSSGGETGQQEKQHPLLRDETAGMNPTSILTGLYGVKGEKVRHVVHEGALRLPKVSLELMKAAMDASERNCQLPGLDSVVRPSRDKTLAGMIVTEIQQVVLPADVDKMLPERLQCYACNRHWPMEESKLGEAERIRGGGTDGDGVNEATEGQLTQQNDAVSQQKDYSGAALSKEGLDGKEMVVDATIQAAIPAVSAPTLTLQIDSALSAAYGSSNSLVPAAVACSGTPSSRSLPEVVPLMVKPDSQWRQHAQPGLTIGSSDDNAMQLDTEMKAKSKWPEWFKAQDVSDLEQSILFEWFDGSAFHRNEKSYLASRNRMIDMSNKLGGRYVTTTMIRRSIPGDVGSLTRLYNFLTAYGLINDLALNDSAPTPITLQESKAKYRWSEPLQYELLHIVVEESCKRRKLLDASSSAFDPVIDWDAVAKAVGHGVTSTDCERQFLAMPIADTFAERPITPEVTSLKSEMTELKHTPAEFEDDDAKSKLSLQQAFLQDILDRSDAKVVNVVVEAALRAESMGNLACAQRNGVAGLVAYQALQEAKRGEKTISKIMAEILNLRLKKLENRLGRLDDVEGLLESERAALELERRDLYTTRCRNWFGGA
ncbi:hypothetical protein MPSEU_000520400 [Mayamaea pseudoterrestris]|nr:hypothetical protein MPSEU_000520400 [Mayamaea pseudoterrestris]